VKKLAREAWGGREQERVAMASPRTRLLTEEMAAGDGVVLT